MKCAAVVAALAGLAAAGPIQSRQTTSNDVENGPCKQIFLVFARASTEVGNMGESMGPMMCSDLKKKYPGQVGCQGVGGAYAAGLVENFGTLGTTQGSIDEATKMFTDAATKCPSAKIVGGGYSQGTAVMLGSISTMPSNIRDRILGTVLFGYTKNGQTHGSIPNYPADRLKIFCASNDGVCGGELLVTLGHFSYIDNGDGPQAAAFLEQQLDSAGSSSDSSSDSGAASGSSGSSSGMSGGMSGMGGSSGSGSSSSSGGDDSGDESGLAPPSGVSSGSSDSGSSSSGSGMSGMSGSMGGGGGRK